MKYTHTLLFILFTVVCFSQKTNSELEGLETDINLLIKRYDAVGLAVAIVKDDKIIYSKGFGYRDLEKELAVTTNTVFPIGSTTKAFTGALLGILESQHQVSLKDKPAVHVPDFQFYNDKMNTLITIEDLLSHKSGIGKQATSQVFFPEKDRLKMVQRLKYLKPQGEIKNSFEYSNMGYTLAGTIVEQVTGKSWETNIQEKIFNPLSMSNSFTSHQEMKKTNNYALPYGMYKGTNEKVKFEEFYSISPAGAIKSTVTDMSNWMITWLQKGVFKDRQVIPTAYVNSATRLQNIKDTNYNKDVYLFGEGFGWRLKSIYGHYRIDHGGNTSGFTSNLIMFPFEKIGIVVLTNRDNTLLPYMIGDNITKRLFNLEAETEYPVVVSEIFKPLPYKALNKEKIPSHALDSFCGIYKAKGFGKIEIVNEDNKLYAVLPTYKFQLEHINHDSFFFKPTKDFKDIFNPQWNIQFFNDSEGTITSLKLYSQKEPIEFVKE